jgi:thiol-disulfide isomerase/thioredoxin
MKPQVARSVVVAAITFALTTAAFGGNKPGLDAKNLAGDRQSLASLRGKIVVLSFWATWCGPCEEEMPRLSKLSQSYAGKDVEFVAVSIDEPKDRPKIQPFLEKYGIVTEIWVGPNADVLGRFGLGEIVPGTVILDPQGAAVARIMGEARDADVQTPVDWLLNGRQGAPPNALVKRY